MSEKFWMKTVGPPHNRQEISVLEIKASGKWLADVRLPAAENPNGHPIKQETFDTVEEALKWLGYPVGMEISGRIVTVPVELQDRTLEQVQKDLDFGGVFLTQRERMDLEAEKKKLTEGHKTTTKDIRNAQLRQMGCPEID